MSVCMMGEGEGEESQEKQLIAPIGCSAFNHAWVTCVLRPVWTGATSPPFPALCLAVPKPFPW